MQQINRPSAGNYNALENMRKTLSGKADSVFAYRAVNPYSLMFDTLKRNKHANFDPELWQQAANRGETDQYVNLLLQNTNKSKKLEELTSKYGKFVDYDTTMLALSYDAIKDDVKEDRFDSAGNLIGNMTQRELIDTVLKNQQSQWDAQILQDVKNSNNFWQKSWNVIKTAGIETFNFGAKLFSEGSRVWNDMETTIASTAITISEVVDGRAKTFADISKVYADAVTNSQADYDALVEAKLIKPSNFEKSLTNVNKSLDNLDVELAQLAFEIRRKHSLMVNAVTGEVNTIGKIMDGISGAIGYMALSLMTHNPMAMYLPMFTNNVKENVALSGPNVNYTKVMINAGIKTGVEYAIERVLGKILGFSKQDVLMGFSDDALRVSQQTVSKGLTATTKEAFGMVAKQIGKDMFKEGLEELLQESSGMVIDYLYGDQYALRAKEAATPETFIHTFVIGALTSFAISGFSTLTVQRAVGVDQDGLTYQLGAFQSHTYQQSVKTLNEWHKIAQDPKAKVTDRVNAAMKLEGVIATVGTLYESIGMENAIKAEKLLVDIQKHQQKKQSIKDQVTKGTYVNGIVNNLQNDPGGKNWIDAFNAVNVGTIGLLQGLDRANTQHKTAKGSTAYVSFRRELQNKITQLKLEASGVTKIDTPVDTTGETRVTEPNTIFELAQSLGFSVIVPTDGRDIIVSSDVIFIPENFLDTDTQSLLKEIATQQTIINIINDMPADLLNAVVDTFKKSLTNLETKYEPGKIEELAIAALMFDKNFQLKMLLETHQNNNTWGTDTVVKFITNLKKLVAKKYTIIPGTDGAKSKRVLSDITKNITERMVTSLQQAIVVVETTIKTNATYNTAKDAVELPAVIAEVLTPEQGKEVVNNPTVVITTVLNEIKARPIELTPRLIQTLISVAEILVQYKTLAQVITKSDKLDAITIYNKLVEIATSPSELARADLVGLLTMELYANPFFTSTKIQMLPVNKSNAREHSEGIKALKVFEKQWLANQSVKDVLQGRGELASLPIELTLDATEFASNEQYRFLILNDAFKRATNNDFAILPNGELVATVSTPELLVPALQKAIADNNVFDFLSDVRLAKPDKIIRLQDLYSIKLSKSIANTPIAITWDARIAGYYQHGGLIHVQANEKMSAVTITTIFHEMIHNVLDIDVTDIRPMTSGGSPTQIAADLARASKLPNNANIVSELVKYISDHFPLTTAYLATKKLTDKSMVAHALYRLSYGELTARSVAELDTLAFIGFDYKLEGDMLYLVSPDGKAKWAIKELAAEPISDLNHLKLSLLTDGRLQSPFIKNDAFVSDKVRELLAATTLDEFQSIFLDWTSQVVERVAFARMQYDNLILPTLDETGEINQESGHIYNTILAQFPEVTPVQVSRVLLALGSVQSLKTLSTNEDIFTIRKNLDAVIKELESKLEDLRFNRGLLADEVIEAIIMLYYDNILIPMYHLRIIQTIYQLTGKSFKVRPFSTPKSFDFGPYSFTKHTGRTFMLTHREGTKFTTQEVAMDTLLPIRANQKPMIADKALRDKMLLVIARKTEVAKKAAEEPTLPEPEKPKKAAEKKTVFQWGQWTVTEFDDTHYVVKKNIDRSAHLPVDDDYTDNMYEAIQVVSKKTLLPDTMLGATGKPILSASERSNILDWIAHETKPKLLKIEDDENPENVRWIYRPNLSDKDAEPMSENAIEDFTDSPLADHVPGNVSFDSKLGLRWVTEMAEFYQKYPSLRAWVEGKNEKTYENLQVMLKSKEEALALMYGELYKTHFGIKNDYQKSAKQLREQWETFLKTPIYFVRTQDSAKVDNKQLINSVSLGYDLDTLPIVKNTVVFYGSILPTDLITYLPNSYAEGILAPGQFAANPPLNYTGTEKELRNVLKAKLKPIIAEDEGISMFKPPKRDNRVFISDKRAAKSNLSYFRKKGHILQIHPKLAAFVEGTTDTFEQLSKFFKVRIKGDENGVGKGTLTYQDMIKYLATANLSKINEYTWKTLVKIVYDNDLVSDLGPTILQFFLDSNRLQTLAIIARMNKDDTDLLNKKLTVAQIRKLQNEFYAKVKAEEGKPDQPFYKEYLRIKRQAETWWEYDPATEKVEPTDFILDEKQLAPIFMRHYDGTLASLTKIFSLAKTAAGNQKETKFLGEASSTNKNSGEGDKATKISSGNDAVGDNAKGVKGKITSWNWLDRKRQNVEDYEVTGYALELEEDTRLFEELTDEDKLRKVEDYLYRGAIEQYGRKPTQQDEYLAAEEVQEALENMTEDEIDSMVRYILAESRGIIKPSTPATYDPNAPARKNIKDQLRNRARRLIQNLAGSKVAYNALPTEVQALIEFTPTSSRINTEAYTNLSEAELTELSNKVATEINKIKQAQQQARELDKVKATIARKVATLQTKERKLAEREAKVKARTDAIKNGTNLKGKINLTFNTKVANQTFTITGPSEINPKLQVILNHTWDKTTTSKVKYMDDSVQTIQNIHTATEFYKAHADELMSMSLAEIEDVIEWLIGANINTTGLAKQTFEATRFFILAYIYNETGPNGLLAQGLNQNLVQELGNFLKSVQTSAGTLLSLVKQVKDKLNPSSVMASEMFSRFDYKLSEVEQDLLDRAFNSGNLQQIAKVMQTIKQNALVNLVPEKVSALRKVAAIRSMSMTSSPMTWLRNIISNTALENLNPIASKLGQSFFPKLTVKTENTPTQYKLNKAITPEIQQFITEQFIESGFFDETLDQISKYNPSQVLRHKRAGEVDIITDMLIHSIYNQFYSESMFDSKILNNIHAFLMKRLSDKNWVRRAAVKYLGKLLAETNHHLDENGNIKQGVDKELMSDVANAFALATADYMHSDNFFSHVEQWLSKHSQVGWAFYKTILPFATASWNWFKAAIKYSPVGLGQSIYRLATLEKQVLDREAAWHKGESQLSPSLTEYMIRRDLGSGIIGTISFGFGAILAALGYISLEDDDYGTPKLAIGNIRIDISTIFGSSSTLAGAAFIHTLKNKDLAEALDAMLDPLVDGFFFTDLLQMDANSPKGWFEWSKYQVQSVILSFIPSMVRYISGMTYTGTYRTNNLFQRAVVRLPFLGQAFNVPKKTDIYTGDSEGTFWDIVHRAFPYFEIVTKSMAQEKTEMYGLNKEQLNGTYKINGQSFKTKPEETARINKLYGALNSNDLGNFYANKTTYRVLSENNKYIVKRYSQMTPKEIENALDQIFSRNSEIAKVSAWLAAGHTYYTNDAELMKTLRRLGYTQIYLGNKGFVD